MKVLSQQQSRVLAVRWRLLQRQLGQLQPSQWVLLVSLAVLLPGAAGLLAIRSLLSGSPNLPDCQALSWGNDTPSTRLYCADAVAASGTVDDLQKAILLVQEMPSGTALQQTGDRPMERWSQTILEQAEAAFQDGDLDRAIATARKVPLSAAGRGLAENQILKWQSVWQTAQAIYDQALSQIESQSSKSSVIGTARKLLTLGNRYWANERYQDLMDQLQAAQQQANQQQTASTKPRSSQKPEADPLFRWLQERNQNVSERMAKARQLARSGNLHDLKAAVAEAEQVLYTSASFEAVQSTIDQWTRQIETIEDREHLAQARQLASLGDPKALADAIERANQISYGHDLYEQAQQQIDQWTEQLAHLRADINLGNLPQTKGRGPGSLSSPGPSPNR